MQLIAIDGLLEPKHDLAPLPAALNNEDADDAVARRAVLLRIPSDADPALENALLAHGARKQGGGLVGKEQAIMIQSLTASGRS